jgi:4-amino-4-deoxy-L-arabinose transferase-like glycosyltransferase
MDLSKILAIIKKVDLAVIIIVIAFIFGAYVRVGLWPAASSAKHIYSISTDSCMYNALARNILDGKGYVGIDFMIARNNEPTVFYGPTYPFFVAIIYYLFGKTLIAVQVAHIILSYLTAYLIFELGKRVYNRIAGAIAAAIFITSPHIAVYSLRELSEPLFCFLEVILLFLLVYMFQKDRPVFSFFAISGITFGLAYLCRQSIIVLPPILLIVLYLRFKENGTAWMLRSVAALSLGAMLVILPWATRNYLVFGKPIFGTTTGPATLWWGTLEDKGTPLSVLSKRYRIEHPQMSEIQMGDQMAKEANYNLLHMTKQDILAKLIQRPRRLFSFPLHFDLHNPQTTVGLKYLMLTLTGLVGLFMHSRKRHDRLLIGFFTVGALLLPLGTHSVFRYLIPEVPFLAIGSSGLLVIIISKVMHELVGLRRFQRTSTLEVETDAT